MELEQWKAQYEDVFELELAGIIFVFRVLTRNEYQEINYFASDESELQELICETACLYPRYNFRVGLGGIASALSTHILDQSFMRENQAKHLLTYFRQEMTTFDAQCDCLIHEAFPNFTLEEISNWSVKKTLYYLSRAEFIVKHLRNIPIQMVEEEEEQAAPPPPQPKKTSLKEELSGIKDIDQGRPFDSTEYPELKWFTHMDGVTGEY